ncbi:N-acetyltransferase [Cellulophaga sp. E16_2]|uniref:GNAT family N-acetyltransferase n=1 Tax=Cellulophaga sp. E16_2 TaxID=2789297 RepID=UPI001A9295F3|nr:GNAT family N-acetyltransferase [Cellulophaga sp. E16_2]MBO0591285.1 N-acetyltransferase [Cellulophaga sp. E16_2]
MTIKQSEQDKNGVFKAVIEDQEVGHLEYAWLSPKTLSINHTEVNPDFGGQGIGKKLVLAAIDFAREKNAKIKPLCTYAKSVIDKSPELQDILA